MGQLYDKTAVYHLQKPPYLLVSINRFLDNTTKNFAKVDPTTPLRIEDAYYTPIGFIVSFL